jgi:hypothetical protein
MIALCMILYLSGIVIIQAAFLAYLFRNYGVTERLPWPLRLVALLSFLSLIASFYFVFQNHLR